MNNNGVDVEKVVAEVLKMMENVGGLEEIKCAYKIPPQDKKKKPKNSSEVFKEWNE